MDTNQDVRRLQKLIMLSVLIVIQLLLGRYAIGYKIVRIDLTFIPIFLMGLWFGPVWTGVAEGIADVIGATMINGTGFFPQFTLSAILTGIVTGWFFYHHQLTWWRVVICQLVITLFINLGMNTFWVHQINSLPFTLIFVPRLLKEVITTPIQIILIHWIGNSQSLQQITRQFFS